MNRMNDLAGRRTLPGILIFGLDSSLTYSNDVASELIGSMPALHDLVLSLVAIASRFDGVQHTSVFQDGDPRQAIAIRLCTLRKADAPGADRHITVLLEKAVEMRSVDIQVVRNIFQLSNRECDVLRLVCEGCKNRVIAEKLFISELTVKQHVKHILCKTETCSRSALMASLH